MMPANTIITFFIALTLLLAAAYPVFPASDSLERANQLWWNGEYGEAVKLYEEAAKDPGQEREARIQLAALYRSICEYPAAIEQYRILLLKGSIIGGDPMDVSWIRAVLVPLAESCYYAHMLDEAEKIFRSTLSVLPDEPAALFGLGRVLHAQQRFDEAKSIFQKAASIDPKFPGNYHYLADIAVRRGETGQAVSYYEKALGIDYQQVELMYFLGEAYQSIDSVEEAFKQFHRLLSIDSGNSLVLAKLDEVRPRLTRKEEEIITARTLERFASLAQVSNPGDIPLLRIGLNTAGRGNLVPMKTFSFSASDGFTISTDGAVLFIGMGGREYTLEFTSSAVFITGGSGGVEVKLPGQFLIQPQAPDTGAPLKEGSFIVRKIEYARGFAWAGIEDRQYRGRIEVKAGAKGFTLINEVNLEEYLYSVVPSEMFPSFPMEALKAQALIARSYALHRKQYVRPHQGEGFDLCDSQHCQVYRGASNEWERTTRAVNETRGEILTFNGTLTSPFYHANSGGHTQSSDDLPGWGSYDYLTGVLDAPPDVPFPTSPSGLEQWIKSLPPTYCNRGGSVRVSEFRWFRSIPVAFLQEKINRQKPIGDIKGVTILRRNPSGHVRGVKVSGSSGSIVLEKENETRRLLGLGPLRSNLFWLEMEYSAWGVPHLLIIYGGGWGHGVGMCQSGAGGMAGRGFSYGEILKHYYRGTAIEALNY